MAKKKIIGYFQTAGKYFIVSDKKSWDSQGEMPDLVDEKIYDILPDSFWEVAQAVFDSNLGVEAAKTQLMDLGFVEKELVDDISDWIP